MSTGTATAPDQTMGTVSDKNGTPKSLGIDAAPAAGQHIIHEGKEYTTVKEGLAYILTPASAAKVPQIEPKAKKGKDENQAQSVFYNPIQQFNRDLSVLAIKAYGEEVVAKRKALAEKKRQNDIAKKNRKRKRGEEIPASNDDKKAQELQGTGDEPANQDAVITGNTEPISLAAESLAAVVEAVEAIEEANAPGADVEMKDSDPTTDLATSNSELHATTGSGETAKSNKYEVPPFRILDALSATGLRALRYAKELPFATSITANDLLKQATASIDLNVKHNKLTDNITSVTGNATIHMYALSGEEMDPSMRFKASQRYDVIDLDPYGTAATFLDAAVQAVKDGGLLCVTCTDAAIWASNAYPEKAFSLYGGAPIKGIHSHEGGLRLILNAIATSAARYGRDMEPLLSLSIDFYARVFVKIHKSPTDVKFLAGKTMVVHNCDQGCGAWSTQLLMRNRLMENKGKPGFFYKHVFAQSTTAGERCEHCDTKTHMAGPMWAGPLHSPAFVQRILDDLPKLSKDTYQTTKRIEGMLSTALEEIMLPLEADSDAADTAPRKKSNNYDPAAIDHYPFFFIPSVLSKVVHTTTPHENAVRGALRNLGYRVTRSHTKAGTIKTDAPWEIIWELIRQWVKQKSPVKEGAIREGTPGWKIMKMDVKDGDHESENGRMPEIVFDEELGKENDRRKLVRYQRNPRENWGPMARAKGH